MSWHRIPPEIFEDIIEYLDLNSIKNLRLTTKHTAQHCLGLKFLSFASTTKLDITPKSLQAFKERASHPVFRKALHLLIIQIKFQDYDDTYPKFFEQARYQVSPGGPPTIEWLQTLRSERESLSDEFIIDSLVYVLNCLSYLDEIKLELCRAFSLGKIVSSNGKGRYPWASHASALVLAAVMASSTTIRQLSMYKACGIDRSLHQGCSMPIKKITDSLNESGKALNDGPFRLENLGMHISCKDRNLSTRQESQGSLPPEPILNSTLPHSTQKSDL
ncbi:hypothetical protein N7456_002001 [Penicillium angulare]|uniref:F-box domain-containing protein n=1 Tax=Penicillium angulare TaxID=116970 RepID=A0A9W9G8N7_9EURO|nr:hypothetical protein N7456_002001 [Penicillium angulare]